MNAGIIGTLMMVSKFLDGITDVIFGRILDNTHTRWGKARPWLLGSAIPLALCVVLLFAVPESFSETAQYAYFFIVYTAANALFYTANNISYTTLVALVTKNPSERVMMGSFRFICTTLVYVPITAGVVPMVQAFGGGLQGWKITASIFAVVLLVLETICTVSLKELPEEKKDEDKNVSEMKFLHLLKIILKNKYYLQMLAVQILSYLATTLLSTMGVYYCTYTLNNPSFLGVLSLASLTMLPGLIVSPFLTKKFGMYKVTVWGYVAAIPVSIFMIFAGFKGMGMAVFALMALRYFVTAPFSGSSAAFIAEISTHTYYTDGVRADGTMYSCSSVGQKVGGGLGTAVGGWLLTLGGYNGTAAIQTQAALNMINISYLIVPAVIYVDLALIMWRMKVVQANREWERTHNIQN